MQFLLATVDAIWASVEDEPRRSETARQRFRDAAEEARAVYRRLLSEAVE